jgi:glycerol-3-phosphate dehydrogenase
MRPSLHGLDGRSFDVIVIGAGINGASAAQHLAAAGYDTLLVEKGDFASGSSSRSTRLLHCGLRYLAPGTSAWEFALHPSRLATALRMARLAMQARRQFVQTAPERVRRLDFHFPVWRGGIYKPWQVNLGMKVLAALAPSDVPLDNRMLTPGEAKAIPLVNGLRDWDKLQSVAVFREYQFEWPERICMDAVLDAERMGAVVRNYTAASQLRRVGETWQVGLADVLSPAERATVSAPIVLNMAGIWIDAVNGTTGTTPSRKILGTKGVHIMVRLPPECDGRGIATLNRLSEGLYCVPWRGMHYFGPTETVYEGNIDDIRPEEDEIEFLIAEANHLLPALNLRRKDVIFAWAGVRPLTYDPALPKGKRSREAHDLSTEGLPGLFALTAGPVMTHRSAGIEMVDLVARRLKPSRAPQQIDYSAKLYPDNQNSPPLLDDYPAIKLADVKAAAEREHVTSLVDLMFRRVGAGWTRTMGYDAAQRAAEVAGSVLGWDKARREAEVRAYHDHLLRQHAFPSLPAMQAAKEASRS